MTHRRQFTRDRLHLLVDVALPQTCLVPGAQSLLQVLGFCSRYGRTGTLPDFRQICQGLAERQVSRSESRREQSDGGLRAG